MEASVPAGTAVGPAGAARTLIFNARLDAVVCGVLLVLVAAIVVDSVRAWIGILRGREAGLSESPFVVSRLRAEEL
jgi:carbon starvation protein